MIEGLRVYPHYEDARRGGGVIGSQGCEECKRTVSKSVRQANGCGWETTVQDARPWNPPAWASTNLNTSVCPAYSTGLPQVGEVLVLYPHWEKGAVGAYLDGADPSRVVLDGLRYLDIAIGEHSAWKLEQSRRST